MFEKEILIICFRGPWSVLIELYVHKPRCFYGSWSLVFVLYSQKPATVVRADCDI